MCNTSAMGLLFLCLMVLGAPVIINCQKYKICAKPSLYSACQQLERNLTFGCEENYHAVDCLLNIENGITSFGLVAAEEAVLAAPLTSNLVVIGEKHGDAATDAQPEETVVIVRNDYEGGFKGLNGKKYCHPGFKYTDILTPLFLQEFETKVLETNVIDICSNSSSSLIEKNIKALSEFFGSSCRPGPWTVDTDLNNELTSKFSSLCSLCTSSSCNVESNDAFADVLDCLTTKDADVAVTLYDKAKTFFDNEDNRQKYKYLCPNDAASPSDSPCVWTKQIRSVIVANRDIADAARSELEAWLKDYKVASISPYDTRSLSNSDYTNFLLSVVGLSTYDRINFTSPIDLLLYVNQYRSVPDSKSEQCDTNIKWCTRSNEEYAKCQWLAQASLNRGLQPVVKCIQSSSELECLTDIQNKKADVITVDANYGYIAKRKNLAAAAFPETSQRNLTTILAVVKSGSSIERFENIRSKTVCFPEYGGIEWLTWIDIGRIRGILPKDTCDYGKLMSDFVGPSCVPGAISDDHEVTDATDKEKLCEQCVNSKSSTYKNCNADDSNGYYGNVGALQCLSDIGEFAVITKQEYTTINTTNLRVLCKNGSLASYPGLDVDDNCALAIITTSEVVSRRSSIKNADLHLILQEFEHWFGVNLHKPFELFNVFNGTKDLLFKDSTLGLEFNSSRNPYIRNYEDLFSHIDQCSAEGKSRAVTFLFSVILIVLTSLVHKVLF